MKPLPTLEKPLRSVDIRDKSSTLAHKERRDVCAVPAAAVVAESMTALVLADVFLEKYGGDSIEEVKCHYQSSHRSI
jgi:chorismate synthase